MARNDEWISVAPAPNTGPARGASARLPPRRFGLRLQGLWRRQRFGRFSLTRRVLAVNLVTVMVLGGSIFFLNRYERGLIDTELQALRTQGGIIANALAEGAVLESDDNSLEWVPTLAQDMARSLVAPTKIRARLFKNDLSLIADSRPQIQIEELPPPGKSSAGMLAELVDAASGLLRAREHYDPYQEQPNESAADYPEVLTALTGHIAARVRRDPETPGLILSAAVPVRQFKQVLGAVMVTKSSGDLERQVNSVRADILRLVLFTLALTTLLSLYLAWTIAQPVRRLADAAFAVRHGNGRKLAIPDFSRRRDEIGELSVALADMTGALWRRMDAIEHFAADVAHEIKNPLSSLRSAVETASRVQDPEKQRRLMAIIQHDVERLDRLISDISDASRLDAEMSRLERAPVRLDAMLAILVDIHEATDGADGTKPGPRLVLERADPDAPLIVEGKEGRLVQVFQNLIGNALSFSPPDGVIRLRAFHQADAVIVTVEDDGPGIPEGKLDAIFDRFYTERPAGESFGTHSGLGLSISKQIVEAHGGSIAAENRRDASGATAGARFIVRLPGVPG
jgi:two-component system, OmpR family, sensor histidine kinase ChvG